MTYMFCDCNNLSLLPDISKWNTEHLEENDYMFDGCDKLVNKPIIKRKKKGLFGLFG